jgi:mono/diheme cytochrome c family protein
MLCAILASVLAVSAVAVTRSLAAATLVPSPATSSVAVGKQLYREFCGQCHALTAALSAGFGNKSGLGANGGPSFNNLRVPDALSIDAVAEPTGGHELLKTKIDWKQLTEVATYIARVTRSNPIPATLTDG